MTSFRKYKRNNKLYKEQTSSFKEMGGLSFATFAVKAMIKEELQ